MLTFGNAQTVLALLLFTRGVDCYREKAFGFIPSAIVKDQDKGCKLVLTDSGGIQEEAPGLGKPVLVMRDTTARPEALKSGTVNLVGTNHDLIVSEVSTLLDDPVIYERMSKAVNPQGDGKACSRIVRALKGEKVERYEV